ncbi:MAG: alkaline phosphatase PhoX [Paracoccaceae bacterium]
MKTKVVVALLLASVSTPILAEDFGMAVDAMLAEKSMALFGVAAPLSASAPESAEEGYRTPASVAADAVALADGLTAAFLTRDAANHTDMMTFYPADAPTHLITCNEGDLETLPSGKLTSGVQRISLADGKVETIVRGTSSCDGIRTTAWGTVLFTEEEDAGGAYELLNPLTTTEVVITDRATGTTSDATAVVRRMALPTMAWEGIAVLGDGVVYGGDELRPGTANPNADGGAMFKFVPATPYAGGMITSLDASPYAAGKTYAMQVQCVKDKVQFGQGCETGNAMWIEVDPTRARAEADAKGATGYYRPEDLHADPMYAGEGVRFCFTNTGNEGGRNFAEVMCVVDTAPTTIVAAAAEGKVEGMTTVATRFIEGDADFNSMDNLDFQPGSGNLYVIEDHPNGDIWACLPDGADRDLKTDGCIKVLSVKDTSAEPTGFVFSADGSTAYVSIQHSDDKAMPLVDGYGSDDVLVIKGFAPVSK